MDKLSNYNYVNKRNVRMSAKELASAVASERMTRQIVETFGPPGEDAEDAYTPRLKLHHKTPLKARLEVATVYALGKRDQAKNYNKFLERGVAGRHARIMKTAKGLFHSDSSFFLSIL